MLVQFSLNSAEARELLAAGFWRSPAVQGARRVVVCRSSTGAALMVARFEDFPWDSFAAGVTLANGVGVCRKPAPEAVVTGDAWSPQALQDIADLGPDDLVVKSGNVYDGRRVGVLLGHEQGFGTMGKIYPGLAATGEAKGCPAPVLVPMLSEKLVPPGALLPSGYPDTALGWASRFLVYQPDLIFDERDAIKLLTGGDALIVGRGASVDGYSVTTYHVSVEDGGPAELLLALVDSVKGADLLPFDEQPAAVTTAQRPWGGRTTWR